MRRLPILSSMKNSIKVNHTENELLELRSSRSPGVRGPAELTQRQSSYSEWLTNNFQRTLRRLRSFKGYYFFLGSFIASQIVEQQRVLLFGAEDGWLLNALKPKDGVGVEAASALTGDAKSKYPYLSFITGQLDEFEMPGDETFDYVVIRDLSFTTDILKGLEKVRKHCSADTRLMIVNSNPIWKPLFTVCAALGLTERSAERSWLTLKETTDFLGISGYEVTAHIPAIYLPFKIPFISKFINSLFGVLPIVRNAGFCHLTIARPLPRYNDRAIARSVSVIVPCKNEESNIVQIAERTPVLSSAFEIIFCDDKSSDNTRAEIIRCRELYPEKNIKLVDGPGINKAENVKSGFRAATGDILIILDADLAVMPEELHYIPRLLQSGKAEFINGSRLIYPQQEGAMNYINLIGNKFFSKLISVIIGQKISDSLCGTKALLRSTWLNKFDALPRELGVQDRWGDFELLFGAAQHHLKIQELAFHYQERIFGISKMIRVFENGLLMLKFCLFAFYRLHLRFR